MAPFSDDRGGADHVPELRNEQDMKAWKREYNTRQREAEWKKKQDELLMQKQVTWEVEKLEKENRLSSAREAAKRRHLEERVKKKHDQVEREYQDKCRSIEIAKKEKNWKEKQTEDILKAVNTAREESKQRTDSLHQAKEVKCEEMRQAAQQRADKRANDLLMNATREQKIREKEEARKQAEAERTARVKSDAIAKKGAQVARFADKQVPMQSVLVSMLSGSPGVTTSTSANAEIEAKREANLAAREAERKSRAQDYIRELDIYAEEQKARFKGTTQQQILSGTRSIQT